MQIQGPAQVHGAQAIKPAHNQRAAQPAPPPSRSSESGGDKLELSEVGQIAARLAEIPEIREDRVAAIRQAIAEGTYDNEERLGAALDALLDEIG